jgi:hypothetical protein
MNSKFVILFAVIMVIVAVFSTCFNNDNNITVEEYIKHYSKLFGTNYQIVEERYVYINNNEYKYTSVNWKEQFIILVSNIDGSDARVFDIRTLSNNNNNNN